MDNLIKRTIIHVPWEKFTKVSAGNMIQRDLVEASISINIQSDKIISVSPFQGSGYLECASVYKGSQILFCSQVLHHSYQNSKGGSMDILIAYF